LTRVLLVDLFVPYSLFVILVQCRYMQIFQGLWETTSCCWIALKF